MMWLIRPIVGFPAAVCKAAINASRPCPNPFSTSSIDPTGGSDTFCPLLFVRVRELQNARRQQDDPSPHCTAHLKPSIMANILLEATVAASNVPLPAFLKLCAPQLVLATVCPLISAATGACDNVPLKPALYTARTSSISSAFCIATRVKDKIVLCFLQ